MQLDDIVGQIIQEYYKCCLSTKTMSRQKLPCTRCRTYVSTAWRPGPCGTASLCNKCGVMYMVRESRPRMTDLVLESNRCVWMTRQTDTLQWKEYREADNKDRRLKQWKEQEKERVAYVDSKKRKFIHL